MRWEPKPFGRTPVCAEGRFDHFAAACTHQTWRGGPAERRCLNASMKASARSASSAASRCRGKPRRSGTTSGTRRRTIRRRSRATPSYCARSRLSSTRDAPSGTKNSGSTWKFRGYGEAANWVYGQSLHRRLLERDHDLLTLHELREIHHRTVGPAWDASPPEPMQPGEGAGAFRLSEIRHLRDGLKPPAASEVHAQVSTWLEKINAGPDERTHLTEWLADAHAQFERIHPFRDGNGRVGRLVLNLLLVRNGAPPAVIYKRQRAAYLQGLKAADSGELGPLSELIARSVVDCLMKLVLPALAGPARYVPIAALADHELSHNALRSAASRGRLDYIMIGAEYHSSREAVDKYKASRRQGKAAK